MNLGQVYTRQCVADFMTNLLDLDKKSKVLDPCFGHGVFVKSLLAHTFYDVIGVEIDTKSFASFENPNPSRCKLFNCDFFDVQGEFDGIIMNPPYVRQEEIDQLAPLGVTKKKVQSACGLLPISTKANLYMYFILKAMLQLRQGGQMVVIFPNTWVNTPIGKDFREDLLRHGCISRFINVKGEAFEGSPMVEVCIIKFVRDGSDETKFENLEIDGDELVLTAVPQSSHIDSKGLVNLKSIADIRRGITTGYNTLFVNPPIFTSDHLVNILSSPKDVTGYSTINSRQDKLLLLSSTSQLSAEEKKYICYCTQLIKKEGKPKTLLTKIERGKMWYVLSLPKTAQIIFPYIVRRNMKFLLNDGDCNVRDNFYLISSAYKPEFLFSLLNNYHVYSQLEGNGKNYGNGLLKLQTYDVNEIRIPHPSNIIEEDKEALQEAGEQLAKTNDETLIDETTGILNKYYGNDDSKIRFLSLKQKRLNLML